MNTSRESVILHDHRHRNPLGAIAAGASTFLMSQFFFKTPVGRSMFGLTKYNESECIRAFNLWVYYTQQRDEVERRKKERAAEYQAQLEQFRTQYSRSDYDPQQ